MKKSAKSIPQNQRQADSKPREYSQIAFLINRAGSDSVGILVALGLKAIREDGTPIWQPTGHTVLMKNRAYNRVWASMILIRLMQKAERGWSGEPRAGATHWEFRQDDFDASVENCLIKDVYTHLFQGIGAAQRNERDMTEACYEFKFLTPRAGLQVSSGEEDIAVIHKVFTKKRESFGLRLTSPLVGNSIRIYDFEKWMSANAARNKEIINQFYGAEPIELQIPDSCLIDGETSEGEQKLAGLVLRLARSWQGKPTTNREDIDAFLEVIRRKKARMAFEHDGEGVHLPTFEANQHGVLILGVDHDDPAKSASRALASTVKHLLDELPRQGATLLARNEPFTLEEACPGTEDIKISAKQLALACGAKCVIWGDFFESSGLVQINLCINYTRLSTRIGMDYICLGPILIKDLAKADEDQYMLLSGLLLMLHGCISFDGINNAGVAAMASFSKAVIKVGSHPKLVAACIQFEWLINNEAGEDERADSLLDDLLTNACCNKYDAGFCQVSLSTLSLALSAAAISKESTSARVDRALTQLYRVITSPIRDNLEIITPLCESIKAGLFAAYTQGREADLRKLGVQLLDLAGMRPDNLKLLTYISGSLPLTLSAFDGPQGLQVSRRMINYYQALETFFNDPDVSGHVGIGISRLLDFFATLPDWETRNAEILAWARECSHRTAISRAGQRILAACLLPAGAIAKEHHNHKMATELHRELAELTRRCPSDSDILLYRALSLCNEMKADIAEHRFTQFGSNFAEIRTVAKREGMSRHAVIALCYGIQMARIVSGVRKDLDDKEKQREALKYQNELECLAKSTGFQEVWLISQLGILADAGLGYYHDEPSSRAVLDTLASRLEKISGIRNDVLTWHLLDYARLLTCIVLVAKHKTTTSKNKEDESFLERYLRLLFNLARANPSNAHIQVEYAKVSAESSSTSGNCLATVWELALDHYPLASRHCSRKVLQAFSHSLAMTMSAIYQNARFDLARMAVDWVKKAHVRFPEDSDIGKSYATTLINAMSAFARLNQTVEVYSCMEELAALRSVLNDSPESQLLFLAGWTNAGMYFARKGVVREFKSVLVLARETGIPQGMDDEQKAVATNCLNTIIEIAVGLGCHMECGQLFENTSKLMTEYTPDEHTVLLYGRTVRAQMRKAIEDRRLEDFDKFYEILYELILAYPGNLEICELLDAPAIPLAIIDESDPNMQSLGPEFGQDGRVWAGARCPSCMKGSFEFFDRHTGRFGVQTAWYACQQCGCRAQSDEPPDGY